MVISELLGVMQYMTFFFFFLIFFSFFLVKKKKNDLTMNPQRSHKLPATPSNDH